MQKIARKEGSFEFLVFSFELWSRFAEIVLMAALMQPNSRELSLAFLVWRKMVDNSQIYG